MIFVKKFITEFIMSPNETRNPRSVYILLIWVHSRQQKNEFSGKVNISIYRDSGIASSVPSRMQKIDQLFLFCFGRKFAETWSSLVRRRTVLSYRAIWEEYIVKRRNWIYIFNIMRVCNAKYCQVFKMDKSWRRFLCPFLAITDNNFLIFLILYKLAIRLAYSDFGEWICRSKLQ